MRIAGLILIVWSCGLGGLAIAADAASARPNVLLIMTDDQGWGDVGFHGNQKLATPHLDRLAAESVELTRFHVCPVCSPTRASLLTGRYNYRTGAIDTYLGRSTMAGEETTLAERLAAAGYRTGIFGKWHLGDNYPSRAMDQGFAESLIHRGGGIGQPSDPPGNSYFDPVLLHNGVDTATKGYASDIFTDAAIAFMTTNREQPFFAYLAYNCPHTPLQIAEKYVQPYRDQGLDDQTARVYGMIANIDENLGRLMAKLDELDLAKRTILIFLTDNGPAGRRYNGTLKDSKGSVHDGGIRVPFLIRWPEHLKAGQKIDHVAAHIDLAPTLLAACGVLPPADASLDGQNLWPLLRGESANLPERLLFFQWHRGDRPERYRACAVRGPRYKLVQPVGRDEQPEFTPEWALYDMLEDPGETRNLIESQPQIAQQMKAAYDAWFDDVSSTRGYPAPRIIVGTRHENPVTLTRQDWRGPDAGWTAGSIGHWDIEVASAGSFDITLRMPAADQERTVRLRLGKRELSETLPAGAQRLTFKNIELESGTIRVQGEVASPDKPPVAVHYVDVLRCALTEK